MALGIRTWAYALAGPSLGYALEFNFAAGIVGCHCAGVGDGARSATSAWESSNRRREEKRRGGSAAGGVLVLNSNEETAHNERATSKAYAHSLAASFVCVQLRLRLRLLLLHRVFTGNKGKLHNTKAVKEAGGGGHGSQCRRQKSAKKMQRK